MAKPERLELQSADGVQLNLDALYQIAPSCFTEAEDPKTGKIKRMVNFDILRQLLGDDSVEDAPEAYEFNWVGKQAARADVLRPINKTLRPVKEDSVDWDNTENLYIEGDNLEVLKLLQKSYLGKVKMIYIDPPYNTGNDFVYHDDYALSDSEYEELSGAIDEYGNKYFRNTDSNGKYHSDWCSMIYSRLIVSRSLLSDDGFIFISIDDNEQSNLKKICDEVFGESCFVGNIIRATGTTTAQGTNSLGKSFDYALMYAKSVDYVVGGIELSEKDKSRYDLSDEKGAFSILQLRRTGGEDRREDRPSMYYGIQAPDGSIVYPKGPTGYDSRWRVGEDTYKKMLANNEIYFKETEDGYKVYYKFYLEGRTKRPSNLWNDIEGNKKAQIDLKALIPEKVFDTPKPIEFIQRLAHIGNVSSNDIILDFFSGSATTADAIYRLNSQEGSSIKFILVQLPEITEEGSEAFKAGYKTICEIGKERIRRSGKKIKEDSPLTSESLDTGFRVFRVDESNYENVEHTPKEWNQDQLDLFLNNIKSDRDDLDLLFGCMLDWGVQLSLPMTSEEVDGKMIYTVNDGDLVACFADDVTENVVKAMADKMPLRVIFRDSCFSEDSAKINIYETFKQLMDWSDQEVVKNIRVI